MNKITDPVAIAEELPKWVGKKVVAYINLNPNAELGVASVLTRNNNTWRLQLSLKEGAAGIIFNTRGVTDIRLMEGQAPHINIDLSRSAAGEEFT